MIPRCPLSSHLVLISYHNTEESCSTTIGNTSGLSKPATNNAITAMIYKNMKPFISKWNFVALL